MVLIDTSVWITVLRDRNGEAQQLAQWLDGRDAVLTRFSQLELLQGALNESEWRLLDEYLQTQIYVEPQASTWAAAARIYFELRRAGRTVRSPIDCCIAQLALEHDLLLLHDDRDFETIARVRPLVEERLRVV